jgi:GTP-binding protein EngB required for normal cell division
MAHNDLHEILDRLLYLICQSEDYHRNDKTVTEVLGSVRLMMNEIRRRVKASEKRYVVAVVGLTNVGKSTLLNALFGQDLAPRRNGPCTAAPIEFVYGEKMQVNVEYCYDIRRPCFSCATVEQIHERLSVLADDSGAERSKSIKRVNVHAPLSLLKNGLVIADTPGFGAAQIEGAEGSHEAALKKYLAEHVSQVLWVVLGEQGIGKREFDFQEKMFAQICDDLIVTGCDDWDEKDKSRFRQRFAQQFTRMPQFHFTSGKLGGKARKENNPELLEEAGIPAVEERIRQLGNPKERFETIQNSALELCRDLITWWQDYKDENKYEQSVRNGLWNPIAWANWKDDYQSTNIHRAGIADTITDILQQTEQ